MMTNMAGWRKARRRLERVGRWFQRRPLVLDCVLAASLAAPFATWSLYALVGATHPPRSLTTWPAVTLGAAVIVGHGALALRRVAPLGSFVVVSAASLVLTAVPGAPAMPPSLVVFPVSLYAYCTYGRRRAPTLGLAVGVVGAGVITAQLVLSGQAAKGQIPLLALYGILLAVVLAAWSLGMFRRVQLAYVAALEDRALRAEAEREERARRAVVEERARIAREMHDVVAHSLAVIVSQAQGGRYAARTDPERAAEVLETIAEAGRQALSDMRGLLSVLRPDSPTADGRGAQPTLGELPELLERVRGAGLPVRYSESGSAFPIGPAAELALYRLVQEALTNTLKHAGTGAEAAVRFAWSAERLTLTVSDTGEGSAVPDDGGGRGLIGMRERLAVVGGTVAAGPAPEGGFVVQAWLPRRAGGAEGASA